MGEASLVYDCAPTPILPNGLDRRDESDSVRVLALSPSYRSPGATWVGAYTLDAAYDCAIEGAADPARVWDPVPIS